MKNTCDHVVKKERRNKRHNSVLDDVTELLIIDTNKTDESENYEDAISGVERLIYFFIFKFIYLSLIINIIFKK